MQYTISTEAGLTVIAFENGQKFFPCCLTRRGLPTKEEMLQDEIEAQNKTIAGLKAELEAAQAHEVSLRKAWTEALEGKNRLFDENQALKSRLKDKTATIDHMNKDMVGTCAALMDTRKAQEALSEHTKMQKNIIDGLCKYLNEHGHDATHVLIDLQVKGF